MRVIGLTGEIGCGKDTVANILMSRFSVRKTAFADPIRYALAGMLGEHVLTANDRELKEEAITYLKCKEGPITRRFLMRTLGTEWGRDMIHEDFWVDILREKLRNMMAPAVVISDVRFPNEVKLVEEYKGEIWVITREDNPYRTHMSNHRSDDVLLVNNPRHIVNDGSLHDLQEQVEIAFNNTMKVNND